MVPLSYVRKLRFNEVRFWFTITRYFVLLNNCMTLSLQKQFLKKFLIKLDIRHFFVRSGYVWRLRQNYIASWFVNLQYLFCVRIMLYMLLLQWHIFHDVRITFFCGTLALRMEITLKLRSVFVPYCDVFFVMSQLRFSFVGCRITLHFSTFELRTEIRL